MAALEPEYLAQFVRNATLEVVQTGRFSVIGVAAGAAPVAAAATGGKQQQQQQKKPKKQQQQQGGGGGKKAKGGKSKGGAAEEKAPEPLSAEEVAKLQENFDLVRSVGEECVTEDDLRNLLQKKPAFRLYDGFEPSGRMHIAQGIFKAKNVNKCTRAGGTFVFWVADWFALMNDKMGGDLVKIKDVGQYFVQVWTAAGMDMSKCEFRWASDDITNSADKYWPKMLDIARRFTVARIKKCCTIMGRAENKLSVAQILYPIMQCTDIFFLRADICQLGVDQRKVNMLAREYCDAAGIKLKPVILSHHMLYGLKAGQAKMSKSDPDSAIFMEDSKDDIIRKINAAYCPLKPEVEKATADQSEIRLVEDDLKNPCLDYIEHIVMSLPEATFTAAGTTYQEFEQVKADFLSEKLSEAALKEGLIEAVEELVAPVRNHFTDNPEAKALLERIQQYKKEGNLPPVGGGAALRRGHFTDESKPVHVVLAPMPSAQLTIGAVFTTLRELKAAPEGAEVVLWLRDWSAMVTNALGGDVKLIMHANTLFDYSSTT
mmetsp:Transcript_89835/g.256848  ORF Transcript_89835/g.256848 Transcript_89835/m.256848 type:complete len:544 (-) Transcript_89835:417-2048(-)